jgi:hypothetical protein
VEKPETLLERFKREQDEERRDEGYTLNIGYCVDAWCRFRPKPFENEIPDEELLGTDGYYV